MARQFIYHMQGLTKKFGNKTILDNIHLSFYPDAKIGVVGVNGPPREPRSVIFRRNRNWIPLKTFGAM